MKWIETFKQIIGSEINTCNLAKTFSYGALFVEHNLPACLPAGIVFGARVTVENTSDFVWRPHNSTSECVDLIVSINQSDPETHHLPLFEVRPGERTTVWFPLRIPFEEGKYTVCIDLVKQNEALFSDRHVEALKVEIQVESSPEKLNAAIIEAAFDIDPWHYRPTAGVNTTSDGERFPNFVSRAKGCRFWDLEGKAYIDYIMGWGSCLLGYADERIKNSILDVLDTAAIAPFPHPVEMEVAKMLTEDIPCAEMAAFGKNGSDVCTLAARLARVVTGRPIILFSGYHGWQDFWAEQTGFAKSGIPERPERLIHRFEFNNMDNFFKLFQRYKKDLCAVMLEPSGPSESMQGPEKDADQEFLGAVSEATKGAGALLIFDEIITGYRYPSGSVQKATGVIPDLTCLGKALASGMPLSALVGRADIFQQGMAYVCYGPTFKGEIYSFAAAKAAINIYRREPVAESVWDYGNQLKNGINNICERAGLKAECKGPPFRSALIFDEPDQDRLCMKRTLYQQELLKSGVSTYNGVMLPSYAHDPAALEQTLAAVEGALDMIARAELKNNFEHYIEIPLI